MNKKVLSVLLSLLIAGSCTGMISAGAAETDKPTKSRQLRVINSEDEDNIRTYYDESGREIDITELNRDVDVNGNLIPSKYDLRDYGRVTPIKNQGSEGLCWDFGSTVSMESNILSQPELSSQIGGVPYEKLNLSEGGNSWYVHTDFADKSSNLYGDYIKDPSKGADGGYPSYVATGLSAGFGAYPESLMPYEQWNTGYPEALRFYSDYRLRDYSELTNNTDLMKQKIIEKGALTVHYNCFSANAYMTADGMESYYDDGMPLDGERGQSHVVAIVGWDDSYSKDNFNPILQPENNGAWLCKNSWGEEYGCTAQGYEGYFWMSYDNPTYEITQFTMQSADAFDNIYQHQVTSDTSINSDSAANIFTAKADEKLEQVCFAAVGASDVSIEVYKLSDDYVSPVDGELISRFDAVTDFTGVHSIDCPDEVIFSAGDTFSVVINMKSQLQLNFKSENYDDESGRSYYSFGGEWNDVADDYAVSYAAVKAYTSKIGSVDKSKLEELVKTARSLEIDETIDAETIEKLNAQIKNAQNVINDENASQNKVDNTYCLLSESVVKITDYTFAVNSVDDYFELYNRIENKKDGNIKKIVLGGNIDFGGRVIEPIYTKFEFSGVFDGNGYAISNFVIYGREYENCGFFGGVNGAVIKNTTFSGCTVDADYGATVISAHCSASQIINCKVVNSKVKAKKGAAAALCLYTLDSVNENCAVENTKIYASYDAGIFYGGAFSEADIKNCISTGNEVYSLSNLSDNRGFSVNAYTESYDYYYRPIIKLTDSGCTIESFVGEISSASSYESGLTPVDGKFKIENASGEVNVCLSYETIDYPEYTVEGDIETRGLTIMSYSGEETDLNIPSKIAGNKVVGFGENLGANIMNSENIVSITIPGTIELVPDNTFSSMLSLEAVTLEDGVKAIGASAFGYNMNLKSVRLPESLVSIGESAFAGCVSLNAVNFGSSLVNIENNAFSGCKELASPDFPDSLEKIGSGAFSGCAFKNVTLGKNIMEIGEFAFGSTGQNELDYKIVYIPDFVINGYSSKAAQSYAESCGIKFVDIENQSPEKTDELFDYGVFIKGDVNLDGKVSVLDATLICKWLAEDAELTPVQLSNALVCESYSTINITNAANIQKYVVGLIDSLDGGGAAG